MSAITLDADDWPDDIPLPKIVVVASSQYKIEADSYIEVTREANTDENFPDNDRNDNDDNDNGKNPGDGNNGKGTEPPKK